MRKSLVLCLILSFVALTIGVAGVGGRKAAYTGSNCTNWKGHKIGPTYTIQGNILLGDLFTGSFCFPFNWLSVQVMFYALFIVF